MLSLEVVSLTRNELKIQQDSITLRREVVMQIGFGGRQGIGHLAQRAARSAARLAWQN